MARFKFRRSLRFDNLEGRQLLSSVGAGPTDQEQYMLQLINEARTNPAAAAAADLEQHHSGGRRPRSSTTASISRRPQQTIASATPQPPVAWNADLANAAQGQSQYMADNQIQSHTGAGGSTPQQRMTAAGYTNISFKCRECLCLCHVARGGDAGVPDRLGRSQRRPPHQYPAARRLCSERVHRRRHRHRSDQPQQPVVRPDGDHPGLRQPAPIRRPRWWASPTTTTAAPASISRAKGRAAFRSTPSTSRPARSLSTQTWASGGYELALPAGQYRIIASLNDTVFQTTNVTVGNVNVEQDFVLTNPWQGGTRESRHRRRPAAGAVAQPVAPIVQVNPQTW